MLNFEKQYMKYYWNYQKKQYENYIHQKQRDLNPIDAKLYRIALKNYPKLQIKNRKDEIIQLILLHDLVEKDKVVASLRNKLDDWSYYDQGIGHKHPLSYRLTLAKRMKADVIELMNLRNQISQKLGFHNYPELMFKYNEITKEHIELILKQFLDRHLSKAKKLIKKYNINFESWFEDLKHITSEVNFNPLHISEELLKKFNIRKKKIKIQYHKQSFIGLESTLSPQDIRLTLQPITSLNHLRTLFHEFGHAIHFASITDNEGMNMILSPLQSEAMAVVFEYLAPTILLNNELNEKMYELNTLEYTRCALSALFEFALWDNPQNAEELYKKYYSQLGFSIDYPEIWSIDSFRSIDPLYIYHYVVGATLAIEIQTYYQNDYQEWKDWLMNNCFVEGRMLKMEPVLNNFADKKISTNNC